MERHFIVGSGASRYNTVLSMARPFHGDETDIVCAVAYHGVLIQKNCGVIFELMRSDETWRAVVFCFQWRSLCAIEIQDKCGGISGMNPCDQRQSRSCELKMG